MAKTLTLVTGAGGFLGSRLCRRLTEQGQRVLAQILPGEGEPACLRCIEADVTSPAEVARLRDPAIRQIYHLAAIADVRRSLADPRTDLETNLGGTFNLLELARELEVRSFLLTSTVNALVRSGPMPLGEDAPHGPTTPYGASKMAAEAYCIAYHHCYDVPAWIVRLFNVYGPGRRGLVVFDLISKLLDNPTQLPILGDGSQVRDFLYVDDAVAALQLVAESGTGGEAYHVGSGRPVSIRQLAQTILDQAGLSGVPIVPSGESYKGDMSWVADIAKAAALGYRPQVELPAGIACTIEWIKSLRR